MVTRTTGRWVAALATTLALLVGSAPAGGVEARGRLARPPACTNADLTVSYRFLDAAMSHRYGRIRLTNTSDHACRTGGFGGVSYVGGGTGTQIGAPADRIRPRRWRIYTVQPGQRLVSLVVEVSADVYSRKQCRPADVDGFRVYVPNATKSQYVAHPTTGCRNDRIHLLSHNSYRRP